MAEPPASGQFQCAGAAAPLVTGGAGGAAGTPGVDECGSGARMSVASTASGSPVAVTGRGSTVVAVEPSAPAITAISAP